jgi:prepilin-type N-terminal cleavage/methylation domain-containing protein
MRRRTRGAPAQADGAAESRERRSGFTLLEVLIVALLLGILAAVAVGSYRQQTMRAKRVEAILGLQGIHRSQQAFHATNAFYGDTFDEIGFAIDGARRIDARTLQGSVYTFEVTALPYDGDPRGNFQGRATGDLDPGDGVLDILIIENGLGLP